MGKVKSIRFNEKTERMFNIIKDYRSRRGIVTDSEIIAEGIELQYEGISNELNSFFRETMLRFILNKSFKCDVFNQLCNMLEILSVSRGSVLQDEFKFFMSVNVENSLVYNITDAGKELTNKQYEKIYESLLNSYEEEELDETLEYLSEIFSEQYKKNSETKQ